MSVFSPQPLFMRQVPTNSAISGMQNYVPSQLVPSYADSSMGIKLAHGLFDAFFIKEKKMSMCFQQNINS